MGASTTEARGDSGPKLCNACTAATLQLLYTAIRPHGIANVPK